MAGLLSELLSVRVSAICWDVCCLLGCLLSVKVSPSGCLLSVRVSLSRCPPSIRVSTVCQGVRCLSGCPLSVRVSLSWCPLSVGVSAICWVLLSVRRGPPLQLLMHCGPLSHPCGCWVAYVSLQLRPFTPEASRSLSGAAASRGVGWNPGSGPAGAWKHRGGEAPTVPPSPLM